MNTTARISSLLSAVIMGTLVCTAVFAFETDRAMSLLSKISSDDFEGRKSGLAGGRMVEKFIGTRFREWGLEPAGGNGTFFHDFPMLATREIAGEMELLDGPFGRVPFLLGDDFTLITNSGGGDVVAEVVLVGHGLSEESMGWDDYGETDVSGKIVLILRGSPANGYDWSEESGRDSTLKEALARGASAVLWFQRDRPIYGATIPEGVYNPDVPMAYVGKRVLDLLLQNSGYHLNRYKEELKKGPHPLATGKRIRIHTDVRRVGGTARNIVGRVPGSDPSLSDEIIIVGAHMDHVGMNASGHVYNGADDNASGSAVVMELARSLAASKEKPARDIVFMTFACEEQGLLGSRAFADHPTINMDQVVAMINFDMVGQGNGKTGIGGGEYYPDVMRNFRVSLDPGSVESLSIGRAWKGNSSDHGPFREKGLPIFNIWSEGGHRFYHTQQDDAEWIDRVAIGGVGCMAERWIRHLADWPEPLAVKYREGRSLLYASLQIDFDGILKGIVPGYVATRTEWFDADAFRKEPFMNTLSDIVTRAEDGDSLALITSPGDVLGAARSGKRSLLIGIREDRENRVAVKSVQLMNDLSIGCVRLADPLPGEEERERLKRMASEGVTFLITIDSRWTELLPETAMSCVRFFPGRGEAVEDPGLYPRKNFLFVLSVEERLKPDRVARIIHRIGWDRVHIDLVPWIADGNEVDATIFLEELKAAGSFTPSRMASLLGGNLERL